MSMPNQNVWTFKKVYYLRIISAWLNKQVCQLISFFSVIAHAAQTSDME